MYSKRELSQQTKLFWTTFGKYMAPVCSADGADVSWINYKTGVRKIKFRMVIENNMGSIFIMLTHSNINDRQAAFKQFERMKSLMNQVLGEGWTWQPNYINDMGETSARIYKQIKNVSFLNKDDWPELITFFKRNMIALDQFWSDAKYSFQ